MMGVRLYRDQLERLEAETGEKWPFIHGISNGKHIIFERPLWWHLLKRIGFTVMKNARPR